MFMQWIWVAMISISIIYAFMTGQGSAVLDAALTGTEDAVGLTIRLCGGYLFFCGMMAVARELGVQKKLAALFRPLLRILMPGAGDAEEMVATSLSMNMLGLGNAATPAGMEAMRLLSRKRSANPSVQHEISMLLVLNATGLQLLPTTVLALRAAAGSADVNAVVMPTMLCTLFSTLTGAGLALVLRRMGERGC